MTGHGHVYSAERLARCGGPTCCGICRVELCNKAIGIYKGDLKINPVATMTGFYSEPNNNAWFVTLRFQDGLTLQVVVPFPKTRINCRVESAKKVQ